MRYNDKRNYYEKTVIIVLFALFIFPCAKLSAEWNPAQDSSYYFGPEGRPISDIQGFAKPNQMFTILPNRPVAARDKNGNREYFSPSGKLLLQINQDGTMQFSLGGKTIEKDAEGSVVRVTEAIRGTNRSVTKNEKDEVLGYQESGFGNKTVRTYDNDNNLTKSYTYNKYGKSLQWITDELSQSKTVFDEKGKAEYDVDFEGNRVAVYYYDEKYYLESKVDVYGNKTYFDKKGNMTQTQDLKGNAVAKYNYKQDDEGRWIIDTIEDPKTGSVTSYKNGKQTVMKNAQGSVTRDYSWDGSKLAFTFDRETKETTWYNIQGRPICTSYDNVETARWLYHKGQLVGMWDQATGATILYQRQRENIRIETGTEAPPSVEQIKKWADEGLIDLMKQGFNHGNSYSDNRR
jgi:hypothetical protein